MLFYTFIPIRKSPIQLTVNKDFLIYSSAKTNIARSGKAYYATDAKQTNSVGPRKTPRYLSKKVVNKPKFMDAAANNNQNREQKVAIRTATTRLSSFSRCGNLPRREKFFGKYRENRAINYAKSKKTPLTVYLSKFFYAATPFIRLKTRRSRRGRRKKLQQKVSFRTRSAGERQSYLLFSKTLQKNKQSSKKSAFRDQIQIQRESLFSTARRRESKKTTRTGATTSQPSSTNVGGAKSLRDTRDEFHKRAYRIKPRYWGRSRSRKTNNSLHRKHWKHSIFFKKIQKFFGHEITRNAKTKKPAFF